MEGGTLLIRAPNHLGDLLMSLPAQRLLAAVLPPTKVAVWASPAHVPLLRQLSPLPTLALPSSLAGRVYHFRQVGARAALVLTPSFRGALEVFLSHIPVRVGVIWDSRGPLLTHTHRVKGPVPFDIHVSDLYVELSKLTLGLLGITAPAPGTPPAVPRPPRPTNSPPLILVHPGSSGSPRTRRWPLTSFAQVVRALVARGYRVGIIGNAGEGDLGAALSPREVRGVVDYTGERALDLLGLLHLMEEATLLIGNDSGPAHLAAAIGLPAVVIYSSTSPLLTGSRGPGTILWRGDLPCAGCYQPRCEQGLLCQHHSPDQVVEEVEEIIARLSH